MGIFLLSLIATLAMTVTNGIGWTHISWWAVPYPILLCCTWLLAYTLFASSATKLVLRRKYGGTEE